MITGPRPTIKRARKLRREMNLPEVLLWQALRKRPGRHKFRRQHPAGRYILDFFCARAWLAIEVDGRAHDNAFAIKHGRARSHFLRSQGVATTRIPAQLVLEDLPAVVRRVVVICDERVSALTHVPLHQTLSGHPPQFGEDL